MERHEALRLVLDNIDEVVGYLEQLKSAIEPEFKRRGFDSFEVGVDILKTRASGTIEYKVRVPGDERLKASAVEDAVLAAVPDYKGFSGVVIGPAPYPVNSLLNLQFLQDMREARK